MATTSTTGIAELVAGARARVRAVDPDRLEALLAAREAVVVDVREPQELDEHGLIAGALHAPRGLLEFHADPASPAHRPPFDPSVPTIVYSGTGARSALAAAALVDLGYLDAAHLEGGITAWKRAGKPVAGLARWHTLLREAERR
jgi:rhodanese-related sulfurtransferase